MFLREEVPAVRRHAPVVCRIVKPSAIELARIAEARNGRKKFDVFVKPNGQSRACASYAMAKKRLLKTNLFLSILFLLAASAAGAQEPPVTEAEIERQEQQRARETTEQRVEQAVEGLSLIHSSEPTIPY